MAFTQTDRDTLAGNIATGVLSARFSDGREVRYQDVNGMIKALALIDGELSAASPTSTPRFSFATFPRW
ncbi:phage head-tail joining protein [Sandarakinorhabdus sp.]|uniref:phage head-tail joining protein n=1 Tax=Sandarakinorhabdus sp. TaxID=1916663 RepID=UPI003567B14C